MSKSKLSLQEQLVKSGLASSAQAKTAKSNKYKQQQVQRNNGTQLPDDNKLQLQQQRAKQLARDRELNEQRQQHEQQKQQQAQIAQLINAHAIPIEDDSQSYHFNHGGKMKTLYLSTAQRQAIIDGKIAIVTADGQYALVKAETAQKIAQRDSHAIVVHYANQRENLATEDPYASYAVPDDLQW